MSCLCCYLCQQQTLENNTKLQASAPCLKPCVHILLAILLSITSFSFIQLPHFLSSSILLCLPPFLYPLVCITSFTPRALQVDPFPKEEEEKLKTAQKSLKSPVTGRSLRRRRGEEDEMEEVSLWRKDRRKGRERKTKPGSRRHQTIRALFDLS